METVVGLITLALSLLLIIGLFRPRIVLPASWKSSRIAVAELYFIPLLLLTIVSDRSTDYAAIADEAKARTAAIEEEVSGLKIGEWGWDRTEYGSPVIRGKVENPSGKAYTYAQVSFSLFDKAGNQVGTAMANINNLLPKGSWSFEAGVLQDTAVKARFAGITAF
jgi:hypothetical protein